MALKAGLWLALALALLAAATLWRARAHEARAEARWPPSGRIVAVEGHPVHVREMGAGPPIVLIHGASGNLRDFTFSLAERLAARYRVIALDRPGLGYTPRLGKGGASITAQAGLLMRAAGKLGAERPILLGHSYGGAVALATEWVRFQAGPGPALPVGLVGGLGTVASAAGALRARRRWRRTRERAPADGVASVPADGATDATPDAAPDATPQVHVTRGAPARVATATLVLPARGAPAREAPAHETPARDAPDGAYAPVRSAPADAAPPGRTPAPQEETP